MSDMPGKKARIVVLVSTFWILAGLALYLLLKTESAAISRIDALSVFVFAAWIAEAMYVRINGSLVVSASHPIEFGAMIALGPLAGAITAAGTALNYHSLKGQLREHPERVLFNLAQLFLSFAVAGTVYVALGGPVAPMSAADFPGVLIPLVAAALVQQAMNGGAVVIAVKVAENVKVATLFSDIVQAGAVLQHVTLSLLGLMLAQVFGLIDVVGMVLLAVPLLVSRQVYSVYVHHKTAYIDSLGALVAALEAKDRYTRGHSERVARLSVIAGESMGYSQKRLDDLRLAGLLHDVGKIAVRGSVLRKPGKLTDDEFISIKDHPAKGAHIIEHIALLQNAIPGVRFHHERPDGGGYYGLPKEDIPDIARVLSIADAYDSMTSRRSYRDASSHDKAVRELRKWSGQQFDEEMVEKFITALETNVAQT